MTDKKTNKKVKEAPKALKEKDLDKIIGGCDDNPAKPRPKGENGRYPWWLIH